MSTSTTSLFQMRQHLTALGGFAALTLLMFGDLLLSGGSVVVGNQSTDLNFQFIGWRSFGFQELATGNLALWNPHIYGGAPYFGGFQAALLYPPNLLYLFLPLPQAINWGIALHVFLMGTFMYAWMKIRGLSLEAAFLAGALIMFGGTYFLHVYAGHLSNLCAMVWAPLIFMVIDYVFIACSVRSSLNIQFVYWLLLGMFAVAMQLFAGHPQYVFFTTLAVGIYSLARLFYTRRWAVALALLAGIYIGGVLLSSVQWMTGLAATSETIRSAPLPFEFAASYAFPAENFLTLLVPDFFGNMSQQHPYWGRYDLWEMSLFIGVTGFICAIYGLIYSDKRMRLTLLGVIALMLVLSLGDHTPLFRWLYDWVPGFNKFRGISKFTFPATLFLIVASAHGFETMMRRPRIEPRFLYGILGLGGGLLLAALWVRMADWQSVVQAVISTGETAVTSAAGNNPDFLSQTRAGASVALSIAAINVGVLAWLLNRLGASTRAPRWILVLAVVEIFVFARGFRDTFDSNIATSGPVKSFLANYPGDFRILNSTNPNSALAFGSQDIWGTDPGVVRRYAEFIAFTQGVNPDQVTQFVPFMQLDPLYRILRLRYAFIPHNEGVRAIEVAHPMKRLQLISRFRVVPTRDKIFAAMREPGFDPEREVLLETPPQPTPVGATPEGSARVVASSTDWLEIEADTSGPAILLMTDVYTSSWRAVALTGSSQSHYKLEPADYFLRAVPLAAGHHRLRVEYAPAAYLAGKWVSVISWLLFVFAAVVAPRMMRQSDASDTGTGTGT